MPTPRRLRHLGLVSLSLAACTPGASERSESDELPTGIWGDMTFELIDSTAEWSNKVELTDLDGDGQLDILFANGGDYSTPGTPERNRAYLNTGPLERFEDVSSAVFGTRPDLARVIKARDVDADGDVDVFVGATYQTQSRLYLGEGDGRFREVTSTHLPQMPLSLGDAEFGDVDLDGDLDLVLADWGPGNNMSNDGGPTRLWLNDGTGRFTDGTAERMPEILVRFSWELDLADVDNDFDLDALVSCKRCAGSMLFRNDGSGRFEHDVRAMPQYTNNYEFEAMDVDGDGFLDLVTINDGEVVGGRGSNRREHLFINEGDGRFRDRTDDLWPVSENIGEDDNMVAFLDYDSDGDADFLIGSLSGPDRLLVNDGSGNLRSANDVFSGPGTPGTLGIALGDLDGDHRIDVVQAQGEVRDAEQERIYLAINMLPDAAAPVVGPISAVPGSDGLTVRARVHDRKSPTLPTEWQAVELRWDVAMEGFTTPMTWYGGYLWTAAIPTDAEGIRLCAIDAAGNETCDSVEPGE